MALSILKRYAIAFGKYKWFGLAGFLVVMGGSAFAAMRPAPPTMYNARGTLTYNRPPVTFSTTGTQIQDQGKELSKEILLSENILKAVSEQVKEDPKLIRKQVTVKMPVENGPPLITVYYKDRNKEKAKATVEALLNAMVFQSRFLNTERVRTIMESIKERLPKVEEQLRAAERKLEEYEREKGVAIVAAQSGGLATSIVNNEALQVQTRLQLEGIVAQIRSLEGRLGLRADAAYVAGALSADPIIGQLRAQLHQIESQIEVLSKELRPEHPQMKELRNQQQSYNQLLQKRAAEVIGGDGIAAPFPTSAQIRQNSSLDPARQQLAQMLVNLETQRQTLQQQLNSIVKSEQELRQQYATIPNLQLERDRLAKQVAIQQALYDKMQQALADAKSAEAETVSSLNIAQKASLDPPPPPSKKRLILLVMGGVLGVVFGNVLIVVLSFLDGKFYTMEEVRSALEGFDVRILGILPVAIAFDGDSEEMPIVVEADSPYLPFYDQFRTNLRRVGEKPVKVVLLTSVGRSEGKTFCAYNLAIASARAGKRTLLIEADLRSPSVSRSLKVTADPEASLEPLRYYGDLSQCIRLSPEVENLYMVPSPGVVRHSSAILESSEMVRLLEDVRVRFDLVILDTPALSECNDALGLEPLTDGMVIVTRPRYTKSGLFNEYVEPLAEAEDSKLLGAIVNGADISVPLPEADIYPMELPPSTPTAAG